MNKEFSVAYRVMWVVLAALGLMVGFLIGVGFLSATVALVAVVGYSGLLATLFVAGRADGLTVKEKDK